TMRPKFLLIPAVLATTFLVVTPYRVSPEETAGLAIDGSESFAPEQIEHFEKHVRPMLVHRCQKCHGAEKQQGGLRLDSRAAMLQGGDSGPTIDLEAPEESLLLNA